jgi:hypothetical protein
LKLSFYQDLEVLQHGWTSTHGFHHFSSGEDVVAATCTFHRRAGRTSKGLLFADLTCSPRLSPVVLLETFQVAAVAAQEIQKGRCAVQTNETSVNIVVFYTGRHYMCKAGPRSS